MAEPNIASDTHKERNVRLLHVLLLVVFSLISFLPGLATIPAVDRDEARFAQATRQMVESGDYITPRLGDEPRFKKPIGIYWLQAAAVLTGGPDAPSEMAYYRLPSLVAALLSIVLVYAIGARLFGAAAGFTAALLFAASPIVAAEAHLAKTDAVQCLMALLGQFALMRIYLGDVGGGRRLADPLLFWTAMGIAILVKGPIVPMLAGLTILALIAMDRKAGWLRGLRPGFGAPLMLLIALPWFVAIGLQSGDDFFRESFGRDLLGKVGSGQESHGQPPGSHLITAFLTYWPGAFAALAAARWAWDNRSEAVVRFCLAWLVPFWIVFELVVTKLPHYTLPAVPAALLLAGAAIKAEPAVWATGWRRWALGAAALLGVILAAALPIAFWWLQHQPPSAAALFLSAVALVIGGFAIWQSLRGEALLALRLTAGQALLVQGTLFGLLLPQAERLWIGPRAAAALEQLRPCAEAQPPIMVAGLNEASMLFSLGKHIVFGGGQAAADFLEGPGCRIVLINARQRAAFGERLHALGKTEPRPLGVIEGFNLGSGKSVSLEIFSRGIVE